MTSSPTVPTLPATPSFPGGGGSTPLTVAAFTAASSISESAKLIHPWQEPLTPMEKEALFTGPAMASGAPVVRFDSTGSRFNASYQVVTSMVPDSVRDNVLASNGVGLTGAATGSARKITAYTSAIMLNLTLVRQAEDDDSIITVAGTTSSAVWCDGASPTFTGADGGLPIEETAAAVMPYYRYLWATYSGELFRPEPPQATLRDAVYVGIGGVVSETPIDYSQPLVRPNGQIYVPRLLNTGDTYDVEMVLHAYHSRIPVLLFGDPGTGKTALCEAAFPSLITISGTADTETADFLGSYVQLPDGTYEWVDGPLVEAMEKGVPLFIDEIALIDSRVLASVYSVMDGRDEIRITANPMRGIVKAKDGFYVLGACNPNVPGAVMSDALLSRFLLQLEVTTDYQMLTTLGVDRDIIALAANLAEKVKTGSVERAPQTRELLGYTKIKQTMGAKLAAANFVSTASPNDRSEYESMVRSALGITVKSLKS